MPAVGRSSIERASARCLVCTQNYVWRNTTLREFKSGLVQYMCIGSSNVEITTSGFLYHFQMQICFSRCSIHIRKIRKTAQRLSLNSNGFAFLFYPFLFVPLRDLHGKHGKHENMKLESQKSKEDSFLPFARSPEG